MGSFASHKTSLCPTVQYEAQFTLPVLDYPHAIGSVMRLNSSRSVSQVALRCSLECESREQAKTRAQQWQTYTEGNKKTAKEKANSKPCAGPSRGSSVCRMRSQLLVEDRGSLPCFLPRSLHGKTINNFALGHDKWSLQGTRVDNSDLEHDNWSLQGTKVSSAMTVIWGLIHEMSLAHGNGTSFWAEGTATSMQTSAVHTVVLNAYACKRQTI